MSPVHKLSQIGSLTGNKIDYPSMLAGYGDFGALQRLGYGVASGGTTTFSFENIPQTFQDLMIVVFSRQAASTGNVIYCRLNGVNYNHSTTFLLGNGSAATSTRQTDGTDGYMQIGLTVPSNATSGIFGSGIAHILNYRGNTNKTMLSRTAADLNGSGGTRLQVSMGQITSAVTSLTVVTDGVTAFADGSTCALYGVKASAA